MVERRYKRISIPFHKQEKIYYCGPACVQMILEYFGTEKTQTELARKLGTNSRYGTPHKNVVKYFVKNKFHCYVNNHSTIHEIKHFLEMKLPVIVNYIEPSENEIHYAIVKGYGKNGIILNDPWNGSNLKMTEEFFISRWLDYIKHYSYHQGIIVVSKEKFNVGKIIT